MNKFKLIVLVLLSAFALQSCKKDTVTATVSNSSITLQALIDGTTWTPDTISTYISYNADTKTKTLHCVATKDQKRINMAVTLANATSATGFTTGTYTADGNNVTFQYYTQQKDASGNYVFVPAGTVSSGSGVIVISSIDTSKNQITGTFSFTSRQQNYDSSGNVASITVNSVASGIFNNLPFTTGTI